MAGSIPESFIDDLLTRVDIVDLIGRYVPLKKAGSDDHQALCPFHDEKTPSFTVSSSKQFYYCFGCGASGSAIGFIMAHMHVDFVAAVEQLAEGEGLDVPRQGGTRKRDATTRPLYEQMEEVVRFYRTQLLEHEDRDEAIRYIRKRGITAETASHYELGYAPRRTGLTAQMARDEGKRQPLIALGLLTENRAALRDTFRGRLIFPIRDTRGRAIGFGGRSLDEEQKPKYINSATSPIFSKKQELYGLYQARKSQHGLARLYIVEGYMDVLALAQHGVDNTVASLGTALGSGHIGKLLHNCHDLVFCFDGDAAGERAAQKAMEHTLPMLREGMQVQFRFLPAGQDPDSYVRTHGPAAFLDEAAHTPLSEYLLSSVQQGLELHRMEQRAELVHRVTPYLQALPESTLRTLLCNHIAKHCGLSVEQLEQRVQHGKRPARDSQHRSDQDATSPKTKLLDAAIGVILCKPALALDAEVNVMLLQSTTDELATLRDLAGFIKKHPDCHLGQLIEHWHGTTLGGHLKRLTPRDSLYRDELTALYSEEKLRETLIGALTQLRKQSEKRWLTELSRVKSTRALSADQTQRLRSLSRSAAAEDYDKRTERQ